MLRTSTVILAAGASRRLGFNKLCVRVNGEAVIRKTVRFFVEAGTGEVAVVTGFERERVERELAGLPVTFVHNDTARRRHVGVHQGGPAHHRPHPTSSSFTLGTSLLWSPTSIDRVMRAYGRRQHSIIVPVHGGIKGHPVLVDMRKHLPAVSRGQ